MKKVAVVYWSGTGNTAAMADLVAEGARNAGADVSVYTSAEFNSGMMSGFQAIAFGLDLKGTVAWIVAGLPWDAVHGVSNLIAGLILIVPLKKVLEKIYGSFAKYR